MPDPSGVVWDDWALLIIQAATLVFLVIYVWKTWEMASATRRAAEASERSVTQSAKARLEEISPAVLVYFDVDHTLTAKIVIENAGRGTARDVRLEFDPPLQTTQPHETNRFFEAVHPLLPSGYKLSQMFDVWPEYLKSDLPKEYVVKVTYWGHENEQQYSVEHRLDAEAIRHRLVGGRKGLNEIAEELKRIREEGDRKWTRLQQDVRQHWSKEGFDTERASSTEDAVKRIVGSWNLRAATKDAEGVLVPMGSLTTTLRNDLITAFRFAPRSDLDEEQKDLLHEAARLFFSYETELMGGGKDWLEKVDTLVEELEAAFHTA